MCANEKSVTWIKFRINRPIQNCINYVEMRKRRYHSNSVQLSQFLALFLLLVHSISSTTLQNELRRRTSHQVEEDLYQQSTSPKYSEDDVTSPPPEEEEELLPMERLKRAFGRNDYLLPENFKTLRRADIPVTYRLHDDLLRYYRKGTRPVTHPKKVISVSMSVFLYQIVKLDAVKNTISLSGSFELYAYLKMIIAVTSIRNAANLPPSDGHPPPPQSPKFEANVGFPAQRNPSTPSVHRRIFPPSSPGGASRGGPSSQLPPSPKLSRTPKMARKGMPPSPSLSSPQITKLRVNGRLVRVTAIRQSAYYSSSEDEDSVHGGTLGKKDSTLTRPPQTAPRTSSLLSNKKKETTSDATPQPSQPPPPPIPKNTTERRSGTRKERAVEDMLRLVQENRDRHDKQKKDYGEYVQARIRPKAPSGEVIRVSRQDYRNSKIIVTDGDAIRISPHREEIETTIEESTSLSNGHSLTDDEAVYMNTHVGGNGARVPSPNEIGQDYANAVLPLKQTKVSSKIQNVVNALQVSPF
uniref:PlsC domain-containing protein n=1 Tax=Caenorhabditis tropicalis TaxID=1561998 RepID=A0A1I7UEX3_9PELO